MNLEPIKERILVKEIEVSKVRESGLVLANAPKEAVVRGTVVGVGGSVEDVTVGDVVFFNKYGAAKFKFQDQEYFNLKIDDVYALER